MATLNEQWQEIKDRYGPIVVKLFDYVKQAYSLVAPYINEAWDKISSLPIWHQLAKEVRKIYRIIEKEYKKLESKLSPTQKKILKSVFSATYKVVLVAGIVGGYWFFINIPSIALKRQQVNFFDTLNKAGFVIAQKQLGRVVDLPQTPEEFESFIKAELEANGLTAQQAYSEDKALLEVRMSFESKDVVNIFNFLSKMNAKGVVIKDVRLDNIAKVYNATIGI